MPTITLRLPDGALSALRIIPRRQAAASARGDRVRIIHNHSWVVSNLVDHARLIDGHEATALEMRPEAASRELAGRTLGHYRILEPLGRGGVGQVFVAEDTRLGRKVALKILIDEVARSPQSRARFEREARAAASLSHSNILAIHDFGEDNGVAYAVAELLEGATLR